MFLSADRILGEVESGRLRIQPFAKAMLKPASYVLRLANVARFWERGDRSLALWSPRASEGVLTGVRTFRRLTLHPGDLVLLATHERIGIPASLAALILPLSHVARFGLMVNFGAALISPGFGATQATPLTLEASSHNPSPVELTSGMPICHVVFAEVASGPMDGPLAVSVYDGEQQPAGPRLYEEFQPLFDTGGDCASADGETHEPSPRL